VEEVMTDGESSVEAFTVEADPSAEAAVNDDPEAESVGEPKRCSQKTKRGEPCRAWALKDDELGRCPAHAGLATRNLDPVKAQQRSAAVRKERVEARRKSALDWAAAKLEENGEELANLIMDAARRGDWRAAAFLYERVHGKPKETVETTVHDPSTIDELKTMPRAERQALLRRYHEEDRLRVLMGGANKEAKEVSGAA
jgi:hypothetical protein